MWDELRGTMVSDVALRNLKLAALDCEHERCGQRRRA